MRKTIFESYTKEEVIKILEKSTSMKDFAKRLGYASCSGDTAKMLKRKIEECNLEPPKQIRFVTKRTDEEIFIKDSPVSQKVLRERYKQKTKTENYKCSICGQKPYWNGKELVLTLDHINGDNRDDRIENLRWVCPNCDRQLDTFGARNIKTEKKKNFCKRCGTEINRNSTYCIKCNGLQTSAEKIESQIDRITLKNKIRSESFEQIAREYNKTSGNAIKKWCKYYNLPCTKREIKSYSDEEWAFI